MALNPMIDEKAKASFWAVIKDCLVEIHRLPDDQARARCADLRDRIELPDEDVSGEMIYHAEPFDVACDLAERPLDLADHASTYDAIVRRQETRRETA